MEEMAKLIAQYGFPIIASCYFMFVMNKSMQDNTLAINNLQSVLIRICDKLDMDEDVKKLSVCKEKIAA